MSDRARSQLGAVVVYRLDIDLIAQEQIRALPRKALAALGEAFDVLGLVPERGQPINPANPTGGSTNWYSARAAV